MVENVILKDSKSDAQSVFSQFRQSLCCFIAIELLKMCRGLEAFQLTHNNILRGESGNSPHQLALPLTLVLLVLHKALLRFLLRKVTLVFSITVVQHSGFNAIPFAVRKHHCLFSIFMESAAFFCLYPFQMGFCSATRKLAS